MHTSTWKFTVSSASSSLSIPLKPATLAGSASCKSINIGISFLFLFSLLLFPFVPFLFFFFIVLGNHSLSQYLSSFALADWFASPRGPLQPLSASLLSRPLAFSLSLSLFNSTNSYNHQDPHLFFLTLLYSFSRSPLVYLIPWLREVLRPEYNPQWITTRCFTKRRLPLLVPSSIYPFQSFLSGA